jgi:hypothetical protein
MVDTAPRAFRTQTAYEIGKAMGRVWGKRRNEDNKACKGTREAVGCRFDPASDSSASASNSQTILSLVPLESVTIKLWLMIFF